MKARKHLRWIVLAVLAAAVPALLALAAGAAPHFPTQKVSQDPFSDLVGAHASELEPSIQAEPNPARAGSRLSKRSTILSSFQTGRIYDGGSSDITYAISVDGGVNWAHGNLPETVQSGVADTCGGPLYSGSDTVVAYDKKYDVWLDSTLGIVDNANVSAVTINVGKVRFQSSDPASFMGGPSVGVGDIAWSPIICAHTTDSSIGGRDSPDKNWITCDNWPNSKGYGNCYEEYDNNGGGNRELAQVSTDGGLTWTPQCGGCNILPGNGNTGDVTGETTLAGNPAGFGVAAHAGDTNIKVANTANIGTTLSAASAIGDTNIKVASVAVFSATTLATAANAGDTNIKVTSTQNLSDGQTLNIDSGGALETATIAPNGVGTSGDTGTGVTLTTGLGAAHASGAPVTVAGQKVNVDTGANIETMTASTVGTAGATGTGVTLTAPLTMAHASGAQVNTSMKVEVDFSGGNQETVLVNNVGSAAYSSTLSVAANAGDTNIKVGSVTGLAAGRTLTVDAGGANPETVTITTVGTSGAGGTGVSFTPALAFGHALGATVQDLGTGVSFTPALVMDHAQGVKVANASANQAGITNNIGGIPLVQPPPPGAAPGTVCGRVVYPIQANGVSWWSSSDCGKHWSAETQVLPNMTATHSVAQGIRTSLLMSDQMDAKGAIYMTWQTRSLRVGSVSSTPNDIAMSVMPAPTDANPNPAFGAPVRIPIDNPNDNTNPNDHFIPGIAVDANTSGATAHLGLFTYTYPVAGCNYASNDASQCDMQYEYVSSTDGGASWSTPTILAHMTVASIARTSQGPMVGDYSNAAVIPNGPNAGNAIAAFAVGLPPRSPTDNGMQEEMQVPTHGLPITGGTLPQVRASKAMIKQAFAFKAPAPRNVPPRSVP